MSLDRCLECRDISLIYWVSDHLDTISTHDNWLEEKSDKIVDILVGKRNIVDNFNENKHVEQHVCHW